ncbi:MAG: hypothetical protein IJ401_06260 [Oscillospiraceae bacterium]|nr:hypothetical protein [Oscillospiraceae bacterium]
MISDFSFHFQPTVEILCKNPYKTTASRQSFTSLKEVYHYFSLLSRGFSQKSLKKRL